MPSDHDLTADPLDCTEAPAGEVSTEGTSVGTPRDETAPSNEKPVDCGEEHQDNEGYWVESRQPLAALVFSMPLLIVYELGVLMLGTEVAGNGAAVWLHQTLDRLGFSYYFLPPILTVFCLLAWHYVTRRPWRLPRRSLMWQMAGECLVLSLCLRLILLLETMVLQAVVPPVDATIGNAPVMAALGTAIGFLGAGIYEELLFRLILLTATIQGFRWIGLQDYRGLSCAVILVSFLFACAHYVGPHGDTLHWFTFSFRFFAGVFFSVLFLCRGYGIAVGSHAGYNMLVGLTPSI